jgi:chemotaxis protein methyltransferase CheR
MPPGPIHLIFCRNLAFTYFAEDMQRRIAEGLRARLAPGGLLLLGIHESAPGFARVGPGIFRPD